MLRTLTAVSARAHARGPAKKVLTLAAGSFTLGGGQVKAVTLHLSSQARALLARSHVLRARATVSAHDPAGGSSTVATTVTLKPAKASSHH
jgi:1,4-dihydroxy-2-naphthoyl-CoA synthase